MSGVLAGKVAVVTGAACGIGRATTISSGVSANGLPPPNRPKLPGHGPRRLPLSGRFGFLPLEGGRLELPGVFGGMPSLASSSATHAVSA